MKRVLLLCAVVSVGVFTSLAMAAPTGTITPYVHCTSGSATIPAGQQLVIRSAWATLTPGQAAKFLDHQQIVWSLYTGDGSTLLASSTPAAFGDTTYWSQPVEGTGTIDGVQRKRFLMTYLAPTGVTLQIGESVKLVYSFETDTKLDDGFGYRTAAGTVYATTGCVITGA